MFKYFIFNFFINKFYEKIIQEYYMSTRKSNDYTIQSVSKIDKKHNFGN